MHSPTKDYALDTMVADVAALCDSLQFDKFHLLGFSMGARVAARFAELHGRRVHKLVLVDYAPTSKRAASDDSEQRLSSVLAHFHQLTAMTFPTLDAAVDFMMTVNTRRTRENMMERLQVSGGSVFWRAHCSQDSMRQRDDGQWVFRVDPHVLDATISDRQHDMWTTIDAIGATCMFVHGADSEVVSLASALQVVSRLRKCRAYASIPNASHTVFGDRPEQFAAHVLPFLLDEQWRPSAAL